MNEKIVSKYDVDLGAIVVLMPENVSLSALVDWQEKLRDLVRERAGDTNVGLLLDTNKHQFESIECLKLLRNLLSSDSQLQKCISRVAFVSPRKYRAPEVVSEKEGYFDKYDDAYNWLRK